MRCVNWWDSTENSEGKFLSKKITNKLVTQIQDPLVLSCASLPTWTLLYSSSHLRQASYSSTAQLLDLARRSCGFCNRWLSICYIRGRWTFFVTCFLETFVLWCSFSVCFTMYSPELLNDVMTSSLLSVASQQNKEQSTNRCVPWWQGLLRLEVRGPKADGSWKEWFSNEAFKLWC